MPNYVSKLIMPNNNEYVIKATSIDNMVWYGTCPTAAATAAKVATVGDQFTLSSLTKGATVFINFSFANTASNPTLNVNGTGAKTIYVGVNGVDQALTVDTKSLIKDGTNQFVYNGSQWVLITNTHGALYGVCSSSVSSAAKVVSIPGIHQLVEGLVITVKFEKAQGSTSSPTLNVNSLGAKPIRRIAGISAGMGEWQGGEVLTLVYDGTQWIIEDGNIATDSYYGVTKLLNSATSTDTQTALIPASLNHAMESIVAGCPVYTQTTYNVGDRVRHDFNIYECNTQITTAEAWNARHWTVLPSLQEQIDAITDTVVGSAIYDQYESDPDTGASFYAWYVPTAEATKIEQGLKGGKPTFLRLSDKSVDPSMPNETLYHLTYYNGSTPQTYGLALDNSNNVTTCYFNFYNLVYDPLGNPVGYRVTIGGINTGIKIIDAEYTTKDDYEGSSVQGWFINESLSSLSSRLNSTPVAIRAYNSNMYIKSVGLLYQKNQYTYAVDMNYNNATYVWTLESFEDYASSESITYVGSITEKSSGGGGGGLSYVFTNQYYDNNEGGNWYYIGPSNYSPSAIRAALKNGQTVTIIRDDPGFNDDGKTNESMSVNIGTDYDDSVQVFFDIYGVPKAFVISQVYDDYTGELIGWCLQAAGSSTVVKANSGYKGSIAVSSSSWNTSTHRADISISSWDRGNCYIWYGSSISARQLISVAPNSSYVSTVMKYGIVATLDSTTTQQIHLYATKIPTSYIYLDVFFTDLYGVS